MAFIQALILNRLEKNIHKTEIEKRMADGGFNSLSRFEFFIWD